jgi:predicted nucleic acid-binding protein
MSKFGVCADAGVLIKLVVAEEDSDQADALWEQWKEDGVKVVAPALLLFELTSVLRNKVHRGLLSLEEGERAFDTVHRLPVQVLTPSGLHRRAWELATRFNRPAAYDAHYLALAEMMDCEFWTADRRLCNVVKDELPWVHWLRESEGGQR